MEYKQRCSFRFFSNASPRRLRDRSGQLLRTLADLLDGRRSLAIEMESNPPIPASVKEDVLRKGIEHMMRLFRNAVIDEAHEQLLKKARPDLFEEKTGT